MVVLDFERFPRNSFERWTRRHPKAVPAIVVATLVTLFILIMVF